MTTISLKVPDETALEIKQIALRLKVSQSEVLRQAFDKFKVEAKPKRGNIDNIPQSIKISPDYDPFHTPYEWTPPTDI